MRESERPIVSMKRGNRPSWTPRRKGDAASWAGCLETRKGTGPYERVTVKTSQPTEGRHHDVTSQMREIRTSGSVGARGEQSPWATRPVFSPGLEYQSRATQMSLTESDVWLGRNAPASNAVATGLGHSALPPAVFSIRSDCRSRNHVRNREILTLFVIARLCHVNDGIQGRELC